MKKQIFKSLVVTGLILSNVSLAFAGGNESNGSSNNLNSAPSQANRNYHTSRTLENAGGTLNTLGVLTFLFGTSAYKNRWAAGFVGTGFALKLAGSALRDQMDARWETNRSEKPSVIQESAGSENSSGGASGSASSGR